MHAVDVADDVLEHLADVRGADEDRLGLRERLAPPRRELRVAAHRVLELRAVRLDAKRAPAQPPTGPPSRTWFAKTRSAGRSSRNAAAFALDVALALRRSQILEPPRLEPLVAVEHEDRQQAVRQLGPHDARAPRS